MAMAGAAQAAPLQATLTAANGEGSANPSIACPDGDGPSWRYAYSGATTPVLGPLSGTWSSSIDVHDAGGGAAFVPAGAGRLALSVDRGGTGHLEFGGGGCSDATLALGPGPTATGTLPVTATGGSGTLRGLTGSGTVSFALELGPGADNAATIDLDGTFSVRSPALAVGQPSARWRNLSDFLGRRLTVTIPVTNSGEPSDVGDAYAVRVTQATLNGAAAIGGLPATLGRINAGAGSGATVTFANASPGRTYTVAVRLEGTDALDAAVAPVVQSRSVQAPLLP
jgi:hypothetical protein